MPGLARPIALLDIIATSAASMLMITSADTGRSTGVHPPGFHDGRVDVITPQSSSDGLWTAMGIGALIVVTGGGAAIAIGLGVTAGGPLTLGTC